MTQEVTLYRPVRSSASKRSVGGKERLISAAITIFAKNGYEGVSITQIAQMAGVSHQLIQHHFGGKRGLYQTAYRESVMHVVKLYIQDMPEAPDPADPNARQVAIEGIATFIRNIANATASDTGPYERDMVRLVYRETLDPPPDLQEDLMKWVWLPTLRIRELLKVLLPDISFLSLALMTTAITGPLYHERVISGVQKILWNGMMIPAVTKSDFFTAYTIRFLGLDKELPPEHRYSSANLDKFLFSMN